MQTLQEKNKAVVKRFNEAFIVNGDLQAFAEVVAPDFINHTGPVGNNDANATRDFIIKLLRPAFSRYSAGHL